MKARLTQRSSLIVITILLLIIVIGSIFMIFFKTEKVVDYLNDEGLKETSNIPNKEESQDTIYNHNNKILNH